MVMIAAGVRDLYHGSSAACAFEAIAPAIAQALDSRTGTVPDATIEERGRFMVNLRNQQGQVTG
jgi:hypothetical protein